MTKMSIYVLDILKVTKPWLFNKDNYVVILKHILKFFFVYLLRKNFKPCIKYSIPYIFFLDVFKSDDAKVFLEKFHFFPLITEMEV